ncbi:MAG: type 4a pilus biogenesis protein PilO [Sedimentisphaerales bacterium]|nr:type 4a pilus biogenesis protein PilO [Sedimentisphaerales bacterium]
MNKIASKPGARRQQMWVYLIGFLFVADFLFYGYMPSQQRLQSLKQAKDKQVRAIRTAATQSRELPKLKKRLRKVEEIVKNYETYVPAKGSLGAFLQDIARIMNTHNLTEQNIIPQSDIERSGVNCIPVHMNCKGTIKEVFGFFQDFQAMDRLVRIEKAVLKNDNEYTGQVSMHTEAVIFYRPQRPYKSGDTAADTSRKSVTDDA